MVTAAATNGDHRDLAVTGVPTQGSRRDAQHDGGLARREERHGARIVPSLTLVDFWPLVTGYGRRWPLVQPGSQQLDDVDESLRKGHPVCAAPAAMLVEGPLQVSDSTGVEGYRQE
ncbi:MAG TPA: hypothetical protein VK988_20560 [Acidimicrobiales bacterium]|nr:hypothetical protein [Acidimicrobiales bacterium]